MEVLNGNKPGPDQARRKQDRNGAVQRSLQWTERGGDVLLKPHSPLALSDVLLSGNGTLDLVASGDHPGSVGNDSDASVISIQHKRGKRGPRTRANLLCRHTTSELFAVCKQIQIDNALVKQAGLKRLYIAAGFLRWQAADASKAPYRAPLVMFPATLARKTDAGSQLDVAANDEKNQQQFYEIRLGEESPESNTLLTDHCLKHETFDIPLYDSNQPLQDYFAQIAAQISEHDGVELEFDIGVGVAAAPNTTGLGNDGRVQLPELPAHFDTSLAMAITGNKSPQQLHAVLSLLSDYQAQQRIALENSNVARETARSVSDLHEYSRKLCSIGLDSVEFQHLPALPQNIAIWTTATNKALNSNMVRRVMAAPDISARHMVRLAGVIELIDKAPLSIEKYKHSDLCYHATPILLQRAKHQAKLIEDELSELQNTFVLDKVPAKKQLLSLIEELGGTLDQEPDIVDADYFNARRQFMEFSIEKPTNLTHDHRRLLGQLAKVLRFRELFVNNTEYRLALGPGYRGLRTDWAELTQMVEYAQELGDVLESESLAATALGEWETFRSTYVSELETLQQGAEALRKLLWVCGADWQTRPAEDLQEQSMQIRKKLLAWGKQFGEGAKGNNKTPGLVLEQFSGKSQDDAITELHVGETQATINEHISGAGTKADAVVETIEWLREASRTASEHQLEIDAIVDHLQIA